MIHLLAIAGDEPPTEFRIFTAGWVETVKGTFLFDETAAASVVAEYMLHGIDLMIDYDHASLASGVDPALSGKAAGWFNLEVRGGELWAVNVRWTPPAAEALRRKEWRFMSPAFTTDDEGRITSLLNVAITNLPATRRLQPLVAASLEKSNMSMSADLVKQALDALVDGNADACAEILKGMIAEAAAGGPEAEMPAEMPAEEPAPEAEAALAEEPAEEEKPAEEEEEAATVVAATSRLMRLTGKSTVFAAVEEIEVWKASHLKLEAETAKLAKEREALELGQRKENAKKLIALGAETPHTSGMASGKLCKRLLDEPLADQNVRVAALLSARGGKLPEAPKPPAEDTLGLTEQELKMCAEKKIDPAKYAEKRAAIRARSNKGA
jgi:phage I-like protein